jgi:hypothetical protein
MGSTIYILGESFSPTHPATLLRNDSDTEYDELSDGEINKLLIVTQTPVRPRKHEGFDRTGDHLSRCDSRTQSYGFNVQRQHCKNLLRS